MDSIAVSVYEPRRGPSSQHQKLRRGPCLPAWSLFVWDEAKCRRIMMPKYHDQTIDWFRVFWMVYFTFSVHAWPRVGRWWEKAVTPKPTEPSGAEQSRAEPSGPSPHQLQASPWPWGWCQPFVHIWKAGFSRNIESSNVQTWASMHMVYVQVLAQTHNLVL